MAAEKLTTARLVQILVVMTVLISAFIWRTYDYNNEPYTVTCTVMEGACSVSVDDETVEIITYFQEDRLNGLEVKASVTPSQLVLRTAEGTVIFPNKITTISSEKRAYFYAFSEDVKYGTNEGFMLSIDQDQIKIKF